MPREKLLEYLEGVVQGEVKPNEAPGEFGGLAVAMHVGGDSSGARGDSP